MARRRSAARRYAVRLGPLALRNLQLDGFVDQVHLCQCALIACVCPPDCRREPSEKERGEQVGLENRAIRVGGGDSRVWSRTCGRQGRLGSRNREPSCPVQELRSPPRCWTWPTARNLRVLWGQQSASADWAVADSCAPRACGEYEFRSPSADRPDHRRHAGSAAGLVWRDLFVSGGSGRCLEAGHERVHEWAARMVHADLPG